VGRILNQVSKRGEQLPSGTFGVMEFQLMLLRRMADYQPSMVAEAAAHRRWQARLRSPNFPQGSDRHRLILGDPETVFVRRFGAVTSEVAQWPMPLWPDLRFETIAVPGGPVLQEWLVRADAATRPALGTAADARPWRCVVADLDHAFAPVQHEDGDAPSRWNIVFTAAGGSGEPQRHLARFVWGLLQTVTALEHPPAGPRR
jgi:hypothetical protein